MSSTKTEQLKEEVQLQGLLLSEDEMLVYKDEQAEYHVILTKPFDKNKKYKTIYLTWEDLK